MQDRRDWLRATGAGALLALLSSSGRAMANDNEGAPNDPFILLLKGIYHPPVHPPNLGLSGVNLNDGSYAVTEIYPVFGIPFFNPDPQKPIGHFYAQNTAPAPGSLCAYDLPGGAIAMSFNSGAFTPHPDGQGGNFLEGTFELTIVDATGVYQAFKGGHNHMVDRLHQLADGRLDEFCFCIISQYQFP